MKKTFLIIFIVLLTVLGAGSSAFAADLTWQEDLGIRYDGEELSSSIDMEAGLYNLKAGDTMAFNIDLENSSSSEMVWWLSDNVLDSIRESTLKSGGAMTYELACDGKTLFSNMDGTEYVLSGNDSMNGYIYLGNFKADSSGLLDIKVKLADSFEGKAADFAADLGLSFALESVEIKTTVSPEPQYREGIDQGFLSAAIVIVAAGLFILEMRGRNKNIAE